MNEYGDLPDQSSYQQHPYLESPQASSSNQEQHYLSSVIDPRLYGDLYSADDLPTEDVEPVDFDDISGGSSMDESSGADEDSWDEALADDSGEDGDNGEPDDEAASLRRRRRRRRGWGLFAGPLGARGQKGVRRGPRRPLEPSDEFKTLHSDAISAFIERDYDRAGELVKKAIQINPEMFSAHSLLSEILLAQGETDKAVTALFSGAHTRPKDPRVWATVAKLLLERAGDNRQPVLKDVIYCYSRVIEIDQKNLEVRFQRAAIYRELGYNGRASTEYERLLRELPYDTEILRHVAELSIDSNEPDKAIGYYENAINHYQTHEDEDGFVFSWSDVNICIELYAFAHRHKEGLEMLKSLSRWVLGRKTDSMWEKFYEDDREWDADDSPRRIKTSGFEPGLYSRDSYGSGLPLELRVKMGVFRLNMGPKYHDEALNHFEWLSPDDTSAGARVYDYADLFREAADAIREAGLFEEALRYYNPLLQVTEYLDLSFYMALGECYQGCGKLEDAENCYLTVIEYDPKNVAARLKLAKLYESIGMVDRAIKYVNEAVLLGRQEASAWARGRRKDIRIEQLAVEFGYNDTNQLRDLSLRDSEYRGPSRKRHRPEEVEGDRVRMVPFLYEKMMELRPRMREGDAGATEDWLDIADALLRDFRSNRVFYPIQRKVLFLGYDKGKKKKRGLDKPQTLLDEVEDMARRLQTSRGKQTIDPSETAIPTDYYGISFVDWLDIFLEYAFVASGQGAATEAYETLAAAADASVWYHSKADTSQIHICWFTCALRLHDEDTLASEARWFIKEYQFVTDTYRLYAILGLVGGDAHKSKFNSSPNMKFMLRQIKAIDFSVPGDPSEKVSQGSVPSSIYQERAAISARDEQGRLVAAEELDAALLTLYGHILYAGNSFLPALNYFYRAYALDERNPLVLLSMALCYIQQSLKRQSDNRHFQIVQGLSFMHEYRRIREQPGTSLSERQEMEFNFARVWHALGLSHLAVEGYQRVLEIGEQIEAARASKAGKSTVHATYGNDAGTNQSEDRIAYEPFAENFTSEAAMALQTIFGLSGDLMTAKLITEKYLVI